MKLPPPPCAVLAGMENTKHGPNRQPALGVHLVQSSHSLEAKKKKLVTVSGILVKAHVEDEETCKTKQKVKLGS